MVYLFTRGENIKIPCFYVFIYIFVKYRYRYFSLFLILDRFSSGFRFSTGGYTPILTARVGRTGAIGRLNTFFNSFSSGSDVLNETAIATFLRDGNGEFYFKFVSHSVHIGRCVMQLKSLDIQKS